MLMEFPFLATITLFTQHCVSHLLLVVLFSFNYTDEFAILCVVVFTLFWHTCNNFCAPYCKTIFNNIISINTTLDSTKTISIFISSTQTPFQLHTPHVTIRHPCATNAIKEAAFPNMYAHQRARSVFGNAAICRATSRDDTVHWLDGRAELTHWPPLSSQYGDLSAPCLSKPSRKRIAEDPLRIQNRWISFEGLFFFRF